MLRGRGKFTTRGQRKSEDKFIAALNRHIAKKIPQKGGKPYVSFESLPLLQGGTSNETGIHEV